MPQSKPRKKTRGAGTKQPFDAPPVVTHHEIELPESAGAAARRLRYSASAGMLPIRNAQGTAEAGIFYMAYTLEGDHDPAERPLMFSFNGGPGSSSVWLHLGALGPKRVAMLEDGSLPPPPFRIVPNEHTWLDHTDIVFIDPVGTGYSRARTPELGKKFWGVKGDIESIAEFIRLYLTRNRRWSSPLFLVGESYGTTRAAGLAGHLIDQGIALNGIVLVSSILNFQTAQFTKGNDLPYVLFLPSYTATAWYHKRLPADLQADLQRALAEARQWASTEYSAALAKGDTLTERERSEVIQRLARLTGLSERYVDETDLRIHIWRFCKELLRHEKRTVGRLDSRFKGIDALAAREAPEHDPSMTAIRPPYTAVFNDYVRRELNYESDDVYYILGGGIDGEWDWGSAREGAPDTSEALRAAFAKNPYMRLFVASGYYDLATPFFATEYTLNHMGLDAGLRPNITTREYEAGHMMYIHSGCLGQLRQDVSEFMRQALPPATE